MLAIAVLGSGIAALDATVVNIALPTIGRDFHTGIAALQWVMTSYILTLAAFLLIGGSLGDRFGRRRVYLIGIVWFLTQAQWRRGWESARLFLTADGEKDKAWGNETIRWNPDAGWLEIKLPAPLAHLSNRPHGRYRLSAPAGFSYRGDEVAGQAATGAVRYDISCL